MMRSRIGISLLCFLIYPSMIIPTQTNHVSRDSFFCKNVVVDRQIKLESPCGDLQVVRTECLTRLVSGRLSFSPELSLPPAPPTLFGEFSVLQRVPLYFSQMRIKREQGAGFSIEDIQICAEGSRISAQDKVTISIELSWKIVFSPIFAEPPVINPTYHLDKLDPAIYFRQNFSDGALEGNAFLINVQPVVSHVTKDSAVISLLFFVYGNSENFRTEDQIIDFNGFAEQLIRCSQVSFTALGAAC